MVVAIAIVASSGAQDCARFLAAADLGRQIIRGGVVAWVIIALSVVLLALTILYFLNLRHAVQCPEELLEEVEGRLRKRQLPSIVELLASDPSALAPVLEALLKRRTATQEQLETVLAESAAEQAVLMSQRVAYIGLIAAIAPMLGLLGTVSGMIRAFATMSATAARPDASALAGAIGEALITTYLGLIVAIPAVVLHTFLRHRVMGITLRIAEMGEQFIESLGDSGGPRKATMSGAVRRPTDERRP